MTATLPRRIEPEEPIRKGWLVRAQRTMHGVVSATYEFTVDYEVRVGERVYAKDSAHHGMSFDRPDYTWTLLAEAPTSWRQQLADEVRAWGKGIEEFSDYWRGVREGIAMAAKAIETRDVGVSLPDGDHGDGCTPRLWDSLTDTGWVTVCIEGSRVTHAQVSGRLTQGGWLMSSRDDDRRLAARLQPWSERGQA